MEVPELPIPCCNVSSPVCGVHHRSVRKGLNESLQQTVRRSRAPSFHFNLLDGSCGRRQVSACDDGVYGKAGSGGQREGGCQWSTFHRDIEGAGRGGWPDDHSGGSVRRRSDEQRVTEQRRIAIELGICERETVPDHDRTADDWAESAAPCRDGRHVSPDALAESGAMSGDGTGRDLSIALEDVAAEVVVFYDRGDHLLYVFGRDQEDLLGA